MGRPVIGICTALEHARWTVWEREAFLLSRAYVDAVRSLLEPEPTPAA